MGRFSTSVHIRNDVDRMRFVNTFSDVMKKRGFAPCAEDEAAVSYLLAFDEGWVTLANEDYKDNPKKSSDDIREMSKALKTSAFSVEVVDSDFAIMTLCAPNGTEDRLVVGDGSGYDVPEMAGDRKLWEPLLADGKTWEQFSEAAAAREVFVEDALGKVAAVLGIEPYYIDADHDEISEKADRSDNVSAFYFKKAEDKVMSLNAAFNKVFGEGLAEFGFKKLKGRQPYFVRVMPGGEIIQVVAIKKGFSYLHVVNREGFEILSGVASVYRPKINLSISPWENSRWLSGILSTYYRLNDEKMDSDLEKKLRELSYVINDRKSQFDEMKFALENFKSIVLPAFNSVVDFDSFARHCSKMHDQLYPEWHFDAVRGGELNPNDVDNEGLILFKVKDYSNYVDWFMEHRRILNSKYVKSTYDRYSQEDYEEFCSKIGELKQESISRMSDFKSDSQFYELIERELERRKAANTEILRSYGLDI